MVSKKSRSEVRRKKHMKYATVSAEQRRDRV